ncbi:PREDICTED: uncharacterized protein LOC109584005 isoform X1 [Amphimedon queenslandica]|uniref:Death domain-containing protein n=1 Tax=Amphimedon queenslandica TaxID=400682 RepID=A0AAN0JED0_AMPQE|nr:PREDICTED: uncharacterized protein LOC109584005 isoform X1 [Amphimedon queenslandica]|eukprot:XP_019855117.1 PREDICTED: uncharacterized protein LOC109584005 isoform X1 [Amphimedon queenslandica]
MNKVLLEEYKANIKVIRNRQDHDNIIYPVNTMLKGPEREEASVALCTKISSFRVAMRICIPIRLFVFEISLQREAKQKGRSFLTKEEVKEIGKSLRLNEESDIEKALQYLHNVTIILYYPGILSNIIFVDPEPILDVLSLLIASTYTDHTETYDLRILGLFNEDLLQLFGKKIFEHADFTSSHMITLLLHLHIIAKVENREEGDYFFPCALPSHGELKAPPTEIQPLLITWKIKKRDETTLAIPQGLFPLTIVHLLEKKDDIRFSPVNEEYYRCNNAMSLRVFEEYHIDIINRYTHLEIRVRGHCRGICPQIRELVSKAVEDSSKDLKLKEDNKFVFAFKCPPRNTCIVQEDKCSTLCTLCEDQCDVLQGDDDSYRCWFSDHQSSSPGAAETGMIRKRTHSMKGAEPSLEGPPTKRHKGQLDINCLVHILDLLKKHGYSGVSYNDLGLHLGLLPATLDVIEANNKGDVCTCLKECLKKWLQQADDVKSKGGPTYDTLIEALREIGENAVADGIDRDINSKE